MKSKTRESIAGLLFITPNFIGITVFTIIPIIAGLYLSFTEWDMFSDPEFIGFKNYTEMFLEDDVFWLSFKNTVFFTLISIPGGMILSLLFALALNTNIRGVNIYRALIFLPYICSTVAVGLAWKWIMSPDFGILNYILSIFGLPPLGWLSDSSTALISVCIVSIWHGAGYNMIIFLAGLKGIPQSYYDAAKIDGANYFQRLIKITIPLLTPTIFFVFIVSMISSFQVYNWIYVMTQGGPGDSTKVLVYYIWETAFQYFRMGYASAIAYFMFIVLFFITLMQVRYLSKKVNYDVT